MSRKLVQMGEEILLREYNSKEEYCLEVFIKKEITRNE